MSKLEEILKKTNDTQSILSLLELEELFEKNVPMKCIFERAGERTCPRCKIKSYYCASRENEEYTKQPDNYCKNCGQKFIYSFNFVSSKIWRRDYYSFICLNKVVFKCF